MHTVFLANFCMHTQSSEDSFFSGSQFQTRPEGECARIFLYKQLLCKQGSTRQGKKLSNFSTGLKTAKQFEKCVNGALGRSPTNFGKSYYLD